MQQRSLGRTGLKVSRLGLGTMTWGRDTDEHEARDQLIAFVEAGGTLVDTAAGYGDGASEELIGSLLGDVVARDEIVLATKAGISPAHRRARHQHLPRRTCSRTLDASLQRLGVDHVDLWQVHVWVDDDPARGDAGRARPTRSSTGRASYVGVSNYSGWQTAQAATWQRAVPGRAPLASTQVEYSLLNRAIEHEVAAGRPPRSGLGVLPWSPLGRGVLTGKYRTGTPSDSRARRPHFANFVEHLPRRARSRASSRRWPGPPTASAGPRCEVALAWVRDRPGVTAPIVGARTAAQLRGRPGRRGLTLPAEIVARARRRLRETDA